MVASRLFVGLDLGGSGTRAALVDADGELLAEAQGSAYRHSGGAAGARSLARALDAALAPIVPLVASQPCTVHAGVTGLSLPGRRESLSVELSARFPKADVRISNDALIALWGGLGGQEGVAVLAGTGSIAVARAADGREGRAGGWGYLLGDDGGGYWLGREALTAYLRALERRASASALTEMVSESLGSQSRSIAQVIGWLNAQQSPVSRLATLAPLVSLAADVGDPLALDIFCRAANALAELATSAARQVWGQATPSMLDLACCGGVWLAGDHLRTPFEAALRQQIPGAIARPPVLPPVAGAVLLAMDTPAQPSTLAALKRAFRFVPAARRAR